jgi:hypothetical protein
MGIHACSIRTPYAGGDGGSLENTLQEKMKTKEKIQAAFAKAVSVVRVPDARLIMRELKSSSMLT